MSRNKPIQGNDRKYIQVDGDEAIIEYTDCHGNRRKLKETLSVTMGNKNGKTYKSFYKVTK